MPTLPESTRASDAEREQHAEWLREHAAQGRLTVDELSERLEQAYAARTRGELAALLRDLPAAARRVPVSPARQDLAGRLGPFALVSLMLLAIWAVAGADYFWPMWPIMGMGISLVAKTGCGEMLCGRARS